VYQLLNCNTYLYILWSTNIRGMVWEFIGNVAVFLLCWISIFFFHEVCHLFEAYRQSGLWGKIHIKPFTMYTSAPMLTSPKLFYLSGGLYSGLLSIGIGCLVKQPILQFSLLSIGLTNVIYSVFEMRYITVLDSWEYFKGRYGLYFVVMGCCVLYRFSGWFM